MSTKKIIKILTDEEEDKPILGYDSISETLVNIIEGSPPKFSIGIYGEWGTGKTTLMRLVEKNLLQNDKILTVWFNAWRYEREENFAITALLKTIAYAMEDHPIYREVKPIILRSIKIITKGILSEIASKIISRETVDQLREDLENKTLPYLELLNEIDKDTIYFDGLHKIEDEINKILKKQDYKSTRIIVFIDDLDRCSPLKALEVFESVKVFLDIKGFVFVIGLSHNTVSKLIEIQYEKAGIKGQHYIRKIIQLQIMLPEWKNTDSNGIIENLIVSNRLDSNYSDLIRENKEIISTVVEPSPREIKRFINNFIISFEIFSKNLSIQPKEFLIVQSLKFRWENFYRIYTSDLNFRILLNRLLKINFNFMKKMNDDNEFTNYLAKVEKEGILGLEGNENLFTLSELRKDILRLELEFERLRSLYGLSHYEIIKRERDQKYERGKNERYLEKIEKVGGLESPSSFVKDFSILQTIIKIEGKEFSYLKEVLKDIQENKKITEKDIEFEKNHNFREKSIVSKILLKNEPNKRSLSLEYSKKSLEEAYEQVDLLIKKYTSKNISQLRSIADDIKYNYKKSLSDINDDLWNFLKKEEKTIIGIKDWEVYRYAADFSKEMLNPEVKVSINKPQDNNTKTTNIPSSINNKTIENQES